MTKETLKQTLEAGLESDNPYIRQLAANAVRKARVQPVQEPVTWDKPSASFNEWWDSDRRRDSANPFTTDSFSYWAFEGWQAALAQRQWVGLTDEEMSDIVADIDADFGDLLWKVVCLTKIIQAELKERNT